MDVGKYIVRASLATLAKLGFIDLKMSFPMETLYILQYSENGCLANCKFCPQSRINIVDKKFLARVTWHKISLDKLIEGIQRSRQVKRICIQTIMKKGFIQEIIDMVKYIRDRGVDIPVSIATTPVSTKYLYILNDLGVDYLGTGLDTVTPKLFKELGKPYSWKAYMDFIRSSIRVFGKRHVYVHLIIGLGEDPLETINLIHKLINMGAGIALFAYTPVKGLKLPLKRPDIGYYRAIQILTYYLCKGYSPSEVVYVDNDRIYVRKDIIDGVADNIDKYLDIFITSGCPHCNRPYYNESPKGPFYNYYSRDHVKRHIVDLRSELLKIKGDH